MSRCFPFPPPGYESKNKLDDPDLLKKEKHREKKSKKEKREKEKKEGKEKRVGDKSDEKHREKKEKKDKHRDKKKVREERDKVKHGSDSFFPDQTRVVGTSGAQLPLPSEKSKDRDSVRSATLAEKRVAGLSAFHNGQHVSKNNHLPPESRNNPLPPETKSLRYAHDLGRRNTDEERRAINLLPDKNVAAENGKDNELVKSAGRNVGSVVEGKEWSKEKAALGGRIDGRGVTGEARSSGSALVPDSVGMVHNRVGGASRPMDKKVSQRMDGKEKNRDKEGNDKKGEKWKEKDREKRIHMDKEKDREKEKKNEEKVKVISEAKHIEQSRIKDGSEKHMLKSSVKDGMKKEFSSAPNVGLQHIPKDSNHGASAVSNLGKRKDVGLNGTYDEHNTGPNKLARTTASTHSLMENGRSLDPCQKSSALAPGILRPPMNIKVDRTFAPDDSQRPPTNIKVDGRERNVNGIDAQRVMQQPPQMTAKAERKTDAPPKPPHPDTKYLSQVLSVPKLGEWSGFDDQEWLFNSGSSQTKKPEAISSGTDETQQVWAKALWLEPVDVYALPYVIPH